MAHDLDKTLHTITFLSADDQTIISNSEYSLQKAIEYNSTISPSETKAMVFNGFELVRSRIVIDNRVVE